MLMAVYTLVVRLDANQIMSKLKPNAVCSSVCVMYVFTEHECVSVSLEMAVRVSGTPKLSAASVLHYTPTKAFTASTSASAHCYTFVR